MKARFILFIASIFLFACADSNSTIETNIVQTNAEALTAPNMEHVRTNAKKQEKYITGSVVQQFIRLVSHLIKLNSYADPQSSSFDEYYTPKITSNKTLVSGLAMISIASSTFEIVGEYYGRIDWKTRTYTGAIRNLTYAKFDRYALYQRNFKELARSYGKIEGTISLSGTVPAGYEERGFEKGDLLKAVKENGFETRVFGKLAYAPPSWNDIIPEQQFNFDFTGKTSVISNKEVKETGVFIATEATQYEYSLDEISIRMLGF